MNIKKVIQTILSLIAFGTIDRVLQENSDQWH